MKTLFQITWSWYPLDLKAFPIFKFISLNSYKFLYVLELPDPQTFYL